MSHLVDILIPTWNLPEYLIPCVRSILLNRVTAGLFRITVVNNGHPDSVKEIQHPEVDVVQMKENAGWEGGLKAGLAATKAPFVVFMNDDTFIPPSSRLWVNQLLNHFAHPDCAAAGPASNVVMGSQAIWTESEAHILRVPFLIGFCVMVRRSHLEAAGGVDDSLPGGDDFDLGIRFTKLGKHMICDKEVFVYHHGFKSGERKHGAYWNSAEMQQKTNDALIRKHGVMDYWNMITGRLIKNDIHGNSLEDSEGNIVRSHIAGGKILELGCGGMKTVENAVGMDWIPNGQIVPNLADKKPSQADVVGDVHQKLPFQEGEFDCIVARHILEHHHDPISSVQNWGKVVKHGGRLIIAVPDHSRNNTIPMNVEHVAAFTPDSLKKLMETLGWKTLKIEDAKNNVSFVGVFLKNGN